MPTTSPTQKLILCCLAIVLLSTRVPGQDVAYSGQITSSSGGRGAIRNMNRAFLADGSSTTLETAYEACVSQGSGTVFLIPGFTETQNSLITPIGGCGIQALGLGTLTIPAGREWNCTTNCGGFTFRGTTSPFNHGSGFRVVCSGNTRPCFSFGSSKGQPQGGIALENFELVNNTGLNGGVSILFRQINSYHLQLRMGSSSTVSSKALVLDGTGSFTGDNAPSFISANGYSTCVEANNDSNYNWIRGNCTNSGSADKGIVANPIVLNSGNANTFDFDIEGANGTAFTVASSSNNFHNVLSCYCQGNQGRPKDFMFGALSSGNLYANVGNNTSEATSAQVSDSGSNNHLMDPYTFHSDALGNVTVSKLLSVGVPSVSTAGITVKPAPGTITGTAQYGINLAPILQGSTLSSGAYLQPNLDTVTARLLVGINIDTPSLTNGATVKEWDGIYLGRAPAADTTYAIKQTGTNDIDLFAGPVRATGGVTVGLNGTPVTLHQHKRISTGSIAASSRAEILLSWGNTFGDTNYTVTCNVEDSTTPGKMPGLIFERIRTKSAAQIGAIINNRAAAAISGMLDCIGDHD